MAQNPRSIKEHLDQTVIGQDEAKKSLAVSYYLHKFRSKLIFSDETKDIPEKSNIMLIGPTGSGKTFLLQNLAKLNNTPLVIFDVTSLSRSGYVGASVSDIVEMLLDTAGGNPVLAEHGIVYLDEIDKLGYTAGGDSLSMSREVQNELLKLVEGNLYKIEKSVYDSSGNFRGKKDVHVSTENVLFIAGGAFGNLKNIKTTKGSIGFGKDVETKEEIRKTTTEDLIKFGIMPELIGRFSTVVDLKDLNVNDLKAILTNPNNSILEKYKKTFLYSNMVLVFEDEAIEEIAVQCIKNKTGARGLKTVVDKLLRDISYEYLGRQTKRLITIDKKAVKTGKIKDIKIYREQ